MARHVTRKRSIQGKRTTVQRRKVRALKRGATNVTRAGHAR